MPTPTVPDIDHLQGRELDLAIARVFNIPGVRIETPGVNSWISGEVPFWKYDGGYRQTFIPSSDPEAVLAVENEIERRGLTKQYVEALSEIVAPEYSVSIQNGSIDKVHYPVNGSGGHEYLWRMVHASPEQRCRAALKAVTG